MYTIHATNQQGQPVHWVAWVGFTSEGTPHQFATREEAESQVRGTNYHAFGFTGIEFRESPREVVYPVSIRFPSQDVAYTLITRGEGEVWLDVRDGKDGSTTTYYNREDIARILSRIAATLRK